MRALRDLLSAACLAVALGPAAADAGLDWRFVNATAEAGLQYEHGYRETFLSEAKATAGGIAAGDYDGDGRIDLYLVRGDIGPNLLFRNRGDGSFDEVGADAGLALDGSFGAGPHFADVDGDGDLDLLVLGVEGTPPALFRNRGDGTFENTGASFGSGDAYSAAFADVDRDGDLDLFLARWATYLPEGPAGMLWHNRGDGSFVDATAGSGLGGFVAPFPEFPEDLNFTPNFADIDDDGWLDLLLAADFGTSKVFRNNGDGTFRNVTSAVIDDQNGMGAAVGDFDNDGDLDWFVSSIWDPDGRPQGGFWGVTGNRLYRNRGNGTFEDATDAAGVRHGYWGWGSTFADFDNDGHLDLFHTNGWGDPEDFRVAEFLLDPARLFVANGDGTFRERSQDLGLIAVRQGRGVVAADYDGDGDLDLFIANNSGPLKLFRNDGGHGNFLAVTLAGSARNTRAVGARVWARPSTGDGPTQLRELRSGNNFASQNPTRLHFGLGAVTRVDVTVRWPSGSLSTLRDLPANGHVRIEESTCPGDCDGDGAIGATETRALVLRALGAGGDAVAPCEDAAPLVHALVASVSARLRGCAGPSDAS